MKWTWVVLVALAAGAPAAWSQDAVPIASPAQEAAVAETESQQFARAQLMEMAKYVASRDAFSVSLHVAYDAIQDTGQKIEFHERREIAVQRPNHVRVAARAGGGTGDLLLLDGTNITVSHGASSTYAQAPQPGDLDASVMYYVRDLRMRLPLAPLLLSHFSDELQRRVQSVEYVESTDLLGETAHHIVARGENVDFQVWVSDSDRPLPLRIVLTYRQEPGQPQFRADFRDWDLRPHFGKDSFVFTPSADARRIAFAAQFGAAPANEVKKAGGKP